MSGRSPRHLADRGRCRLHLQPDLRADLLQLLSLLIPDLQQALGHVVSVRPLEGWLLLAGSDYLKQMIRISRLPRERR